MEKIEWRCSLEINEVVDCNMWKPIMRRKHKERSIQVGRDSFVDNEEYSPKKCKTSQLISISFEQLEITSIQTYTSVKISPLERYA